MERLKNQFGMLGAAVALVAGYSLLVVRPQQAALARAGDALREARQELGARHDLAHSSTAMEADLRALRARQAAFDEEIPPTDDLGELVARLASAAAEAGLKASDMRPRAGITVGELGVLPIDLELTGSFTALHTFVRRIESMQRIVRVAQLDSRQVGRPGTPLAHKLTVFVFYESQPRT